MNSRFKGFGKTIKAKLKFLSGRTAAGCPGTKVRLGQVVLSQDCDSISILNKSLYFKRAKARSRTANEKVKVKVKVKAKKFRNSMILPKLSDDF